MPHIPERSQDLVGIATMRQVWAERRFETHEGYPVEGVDLDMIGVLVERLKNPDALSDQERLGWIDVLDEITKEAHRKGAIQW